MQSLDPINEDDFALWLRNQSNYNYSRKLEIYTAAKSVTGYLPDYFVMEEFELDYLALPEHKRAQYPISDRDYICKSFIKEEMYVKDAPPRFINARSDRLKAVMGPITHQIEKKLFALPHFVKGSNWDDIPKKILRLRNFQHFFVSDFTSFESSFNIELAKACEIS